MFTPGIAAELLNTPPSTLRRYAVLFKAYLSSAARKRRRLYTQQDIDTIAQIKELLSDGVLIKDIPPILEKVIDQDHNESIALTLPGLILQLQDMQAAFDNQSSQLDQLQKRLDWLETPFYKRIGKKPPGCAFQPE